MTKPSHSKCQGLLAPPCTAELSTLVSLSNQGITKEAGERTCRWWDTFVSHINVPLTFVNLWDFNQEMDKSRSTVINKLLLFIKVYWAHMIKQKHSTERFTCTHYWGEMLNQFRIYIGRWELFYCQSGTQHKFNGFQIQELAGVKEGLSNLRTLFHLSNIVVVPLCWVFLIFLMPLILNLQLDSWNFDLVECSNIMISNAHKNWFLNKVDFWKGLIRAPT